MNWKWVAASAAVVCMLALQGQAETVEPEISEEWHIGPRIGGSPYTGILGVEVQWRAYAFGIGEILDGVSSGLRYYFSPQKHSWYLGAFLLLAEEEYTGYFYVTPETTEQLVEKRYRLGLGGGHRWRWGSGWDLSLGLGVAYRYEELKGQTTGNTDEISGIWFIPELACGYSF
jgi:hypothetical protein